MLSWLLGKYEGDPKIMVTAICKALTAVIMTTVVFSRYYKWVLRKSFLSLRYYRAIETQYIFTDFLHNNLLH